MESPHTIWKPKVYVCTYIVVNLNFNIFHWFDASIVFWYELQQDFNLLCWLRATKGIFPQFVQVAHGNNDNMNGYKEKYSQ